MFGSIGMPEMLVILVIALVLFGPGKLPELGSSIGRAIRDFKKAMEDPEKKSPISTDAGSIEHKKKE